MFHDVGRNEFHWNSHVLILCHWRTQVEIFNVNSHEFGSRCGDNAVDEDLDSGELGCGSGDFSFVVDFVAAGGESNSMRFCFVGFEGGDDA